MISALSAHSQEKSLELSVYGGWNGYKKLSNTYNSNFSSGFGFGLQSKYYLKDKVFWVMDIYGGTDDGTERQSPLAKDKNGILSLYRTDFSGSTGIGYNFLQLGITNLYGQLCIGVGNASGYTSYYKNSDFTGYEREKFNKTSYIVAPSVGLDVAVFNNWKLGAAYTMRYLGGFDINHSFAAKITYVMK